MKTVLVMAAFLLIPFAGRAQQPQIIAFGEDGTLTWTNGTVSGFYSVESTPDLRFMWMPCTTDTWNQVSSGSVDTCKLPLSVFDAVDVPIPAMSGLMSRAFFRLVVSSNQIPMPLVTNAIRMVNQSSGPLSNIVVGSIANWTHTQVTNIPVLNPQEASDWVGIGVPYAFVITAIASGSNIVSYSDGWYLTYQQSATNRSLQMPVLVLGPDRKEIVGVVSNGSITANFTWLNWTITRQW